MSRSFSLLLLFVIAGAVSAQGQPEPLVKKVKTSIANGVEYLISQQATNGSWGNTIDPNDRERTDFSGGSTGLAVLALLQCEGVLDDPLLEKRRKGSIAKGLDNLRTFQPTTTYVRALQTMAFAEARTEMQIVKANVQWLIDARSFLDGRFVGWGYSAPRRGENDASNSQYAMLALWYARQAGIDVPRNVWQDIHGYYQRTQQPSGAWGYSAYYKDMNKPSVTMTVAGLCGLLISSSELNAGREAWPPAGKVQNCGIYSDDEAIAKGFRWLNGNPAMKFRGNFTLEIPGATYYHLYGLERAGRLSGMRFFGEHDWYREGCEFLVQRQDVNGAWPKIEGHDRWPHVNTSFALLFLSKGRTPVLISKLVHAAGGKFPRDERDTDWNNDRNDLRNLTEYLSRDDKLFGKNKQFAWQTYDIRRSIESQEKRDDDTVVADMLQTPILYLTGHKSPLRRFTDDEKALIRNYVQNGGFIFAEACCGSKEFDDGIKDLVQDLWEGRHKLELIESTHPVWTCHNVINAGDPFKLYELQMGCRTVMIYSPQDLSCHWESNRYKEGATKRAFELGANIIAFGTGRTPPQPRLTPIELANTSRELPRSSKRGLFHVGQIRQSANWQPAKRAMPRLLEHVHELAGLDVNLRTEEVRLSEPTKVLESKFLYLHSRDAFRVDPAHLKALRFNLEHGGLLFADACCGSPVFDKSFRQFVQELFPKESLARLSTDPKTRDPLFGPDMNDGKTPITRANIKCRTTPGGKLEPMEPHLEGIQIDGRWVVLYSKYDVGCALEGSTSADCAGYDHASALRIATAAVLYNARP